MELNKLGGLDMKLTVLGNNGPYPAASGACSGYLISSESGKTNLLLDCGSGVLAQLPRSISWDRLDAVVLSHLHFDHMSDMLPMQYALQFHPRAPLPVYAPETPAPVRALLNAPAFDLHPMEDVQIGEMHLRFLPVRHPVECYAVLVECDGRTFAYTGDTNTLPTLGDFFRHADVLLADAGLSEADWTPASPHLSARACAQLAANADVGRLLLTHLNPRYAPALLESEARALRPDARCVYIGETAEI